MTLQQTQIILAKLREGFNREANPAEAVTMNAYMKDIAPYYGLNSEARRALQKEIMGEWKPNWNQLSFFAEEGWQNEEREWQYCSIETLWKHKKIWPDEAINLIERLIISKSWWDTIDTLAATHCGYFFSKHPDKIPAYIPDWIASNNLWLNRSAMLFQLKYRDKTDVALLKQSIVPHLHSKEFSHQKAIGWVLRQYARTDQEWVKDFVAGHPLKPLSKREALKHLE